MIDGIDNCFSPKLFRTRGRNQKNLNNVYVFALCTTILLRGIRTRRMNNCAMLGKKSEKSLYSMALSI